MRTTQKTIASYIASAPAASRAHLRQIYRTIQAAAPMASETIAYGIPTFTLHGNLVHFGGFAAHVGFYPGPGAIRAFAVQLAPYACSKGTVKFPLNTPIPRALVARMVRFRVAQQRERKRKPASR